jgi:putative DNA primase/helicase
VTGYPTLAELIPERVLKAALRWLGIDAGTAPRTERVVQPSGDARVELEVLTGRMAELAEQAEAVLAQAPDCDLYQSGGRIVFPAREAGPDGTASYALVTADEHALALRLSERIRFVKRAVVRNMPVTVDVEVPRQLPAFMLARRGRWQYRYLRGVVSVPVIRPDGSIAAREGYDASTGLLLTNLPPGLNVPERPTPADAVQALRVLSELLREFPFESETDAAAALSALLSAVLRPSWGRFRCTCSRRP